MSYMRGEYHLWRSEDRTHFSAAGGNFGAKDLAELGPAIVAALAPLR
jgi:hypothetical protein